MQIMTRTGKTLSNNWLIFLKRLEAESMAVLNLKEECQNEKIEVEEQQMGDRRSDIPRVRLEIEE
jgi:hypothetical protein